MKTQTPIQIRAGDLKSALAGLGKLIPRSQTSLPVLHCVKVEMPRRGILRFTATDLHLTLTLDVPATWEKKVEPFLVPMNRLREMTRQTRADERLTISLVSKTPPLEEFPDTSGFRASPIELPDSAVAGLVHAFACSSRDESRHILRGAFLDTSGKGPKAHRIVGTDGRHLFSSNSLHLPEVKKPVILPDHKIWQWKPIAEARPWTLRFGAEKNGTTPFRIVAPGWSVQGTTVEGNYPNYRQVIPPRDQFKTRVALSEEALDAMVRLIPRLPGKKLANQPVGLHLEKGKLGLLARESNDEPWILHPIDSVEGRGLQDLSLSPNGGGRSYPFFVRAEIEGGNLQLFDYPTTLGASYQAIEVALAAGYLGQTESQKVLEAKEIANFHRTLEILLQGPDAIGFTHRIKFVQEPK